MTDPNLFARRVFLGAGIYGIAALLPQYFLVERMARDFPPPLTHPEHFYGFVGVALAWQLAFLVIATDVARFRPLMLPAVAEKLLFAVPAIALWARGRAPDPVAGFAAVDLVLAALFLVSYLRRGRPFAEPG